MKTVIKLLFLLAAFSASYAQNDKTIYIEYQKDMIIKNFNSKISLSFNINSSDKKVNTYNFKVDNLTKGFKTLTFKKLKDTISIKKHDIVKTLKDFSTLKPCDLHYLFSESKNIILIKKENNIYLKYKLIYWSTQRGWEIMKL